MMLTAMVSHPFRTERERMGHPRFFHWRKGWATRPDLQRFTWVDHFHGSRITCWNQLGPDRCERNASRM